VNSGAQKHASGPGLRPLVSAEYVDCPLGPEGAFLPSYVGYELVPCEGLTRRGITQVDKPRFAPLSLIVLVLNIRYFGVRTIRVSIFSRITGHGRPATLALELTTLIIAVFRERLGTSSAT